MVAIWVGTGTSPFVGHDGKPWADNLRFSRHKLEQNECLSLIELNEGTLLTYCRV